jgi:bacteriocin biosynthesis cyclodehydratase domain-containing protein
MDDPPPPAHQLAPGLRVVRRGHDQLQVGLHDARRVVLPRTAAAERTLEALLARRPLDPDEQTAAVLDRLERHDCLTGRDEAVRRGQRRRDQRVAVVGALPGLDATDLLASVGVTAVAVAHGATAPAETEVVLVLSTGELARDLLDPLIRRGASHLVVRLVDGAALIGPFVVPGVTACLRCIDAHLSLRDPDHVAITSRYVRATAGARPDGVPDVADPVLGPVAVAWAVRDVVAHLEGRRPSTWSRTLFLEDEPARRTEQDWSRHPTCGCCWSAHAPLSGTMGV